MKSYIVLLNIFLLITSLVHAQTYKNENIFVINRIQYYIATDESTYSQGDTVYMICKQTNLNSYPITLRFGSSQRFDFWTHNWRWSYGKVFAALYWQSILQPGEFIQEIYAWNMHDNEGNLEPSGIYQIFGMITCYERLPLSVTIIIQLSTIIANQENLPEPTHFKLVQNYPNPFNSTTTLSYALSQPTQVRLQIFDINGREVKSLVNDFQDVGVYSIIWNGENETSHKVTSGIYICRLAVGEVVLHRKLILAK